VAKRSKKPVDLNDDEDDEDKKILQEAKDNFKRWQDWEVDFRSRYIADVKFANADSDNGWQWPQDLRADREANKRPALTINKVGRLGAMITNDASENKPAITIKPTGNESSYKSALVYEGLVRDIEYKSAAVNIYDDCSISQVEGGIAYFRVVTKFVDDNEPKLDETAFNQEIRLEPVRDHLGVFLDCDIKQKDGSDALWGGVFDDMPIKEFEKLNPDIDMAEVAGQTIFHEDEGETWLKEDSIRLAEYYRIVQSDDEIYWVEDEQGKSEVFRASEAPKNFKQALVPGKFKKRKTITRKLEWYKIAGNQIIDRKVLKGRYIPLVRVVGIEKIIDGKLERKGYIRAMKDPQRMFNYNASGEVEGVAVQTKTPWVGPAAAFEGNEAAWNNANTQNAAYLTYKHLDADGNPLPAPQRLEPPKSIDGFIQGMAMADNQMAMVGGREDAALGREGQEKSGVAISQRQRQGDIANSIWLKNLAVALCYAGRIIVDLVPHIYDTRRVIQIMGLDGVQSKVTVDPTAEDAYQEVKEQDVVNVMFNPTVGKYEVQSAPGPAYATQRQEAWNAFVTIVSRAPDLISKIGDLMFRSADFPLADKIAERLRREIQTNAPYLLGDGGQNPQMQAMQQQLTDAQGQVGELIQKLAEKNIELKNRDEEHSIGRFEADSKRLTAEANAIEKVQASQRELQQLMMSITQTLHDMKGDDMDRATDAAAATDSDTDPGDADGSDPLVEQNEIPPFEGAKKAKDGNWYYEHSPGQFSAVLPSGAGQ
jgi:hypothetical protein